MELQFRLYLSYCDYRGEKGVGLIGCPILSFSLGFTSELLFRIYVLELLLLLRDKGMRLFECPLLSFSLGFTSEL